MVQQLTPAETLEDVFKTLSPEPLLEREEMDAFYRGEVNEVRGRDLVQQMAFQLRRQHGGAFYKAFLMGRPGVGKSTEITRLLREVDALYRPIRFSVLKDLDPGSFKPFDVLLLMVIRIAEETRDATGRAPSESVLKQIWEWYGVTTTTRTDLDHAAAEASAGIGPTADSYWGKFLGLFASIKGEIKFSADRKTEVVEYRLARISALLDLANGLLIECNRILRDTTNQEWLFVGEDFDKPGIRAGLNEDLFVNYANVLQEMLTHLLFNIPLSLFHSLKGTSLPRLSGPCRSIPDTPVFEKDHAPHHAGRRALQSILEARVRPHLFEDGQMMRLIVASGGNVRDLFQLVTTAALEAATAAPPRALIGRAHADRAISDLRNEYHERLGQSPDDPAPLKYADKAERLVKTYNQEPEAEMHDPIVHSLLAAGAVQEFLNGDPWHGVHPLVVDILNRQGRLGAPGGDPAPGGTK